MQQIAVELGDNSYDVLIDAGLLQRAGELLSAHARDARMLVVTDSNVALHVGPDFLAGLKVFAAFDRVGLDVARRDPDELRRNSA